MVATLFLNGCPKRLTSVDALDWLLDAIVRDRDPERPLIERIADLHGCCVDLGLGAPEVPVMIWLDPPARESFITVNPLARLDGKRHEVFWLHGVDRTDVETCHLI